MIVLKDILVNPFLIRVQVIAIHICLEAAQIVSIPVVVVPKLQKGRKLLVSHLLPQKLSLAAMVIIQVVQIQLAVHSVNFEPAPNIFNAYDKLQINIEKVFQVSIK